MASKKEVKKDILFFVEEVLADCLVFLELHSDKEYPEVENIIDDMEKLYSDSIYKINHLVKEDRQQVKQFYNDIYNTLLDNTHQAFEKLSQLAQKNE
jgi:hypothetical protein